MMCQICISCLLVKLSSKIECCIINEVEKKHGSRFLIFVSHLVCIVCLSIKDDFICSFIFNGFLNPNVDIDNFFVNWVFWGYPKDVTMSIVRELS